MFEHTNIRAIYGYSGLPDDPDCPGDDDADKFLVSLAIIVARALDLKKGTDLSIAHLALQLCGELPPGGAGTADSSVSGRRLRLNAAFYLFGPDGVEDEESITCTGPMVDPFSAQLGFNVVRHSDMTEKEFKIGMVLSRDSRLPLEA